MTKTIIKKDEYRKCPVDTSDSITEVYILKLKFIKIW